MLKLKGLVITLDHKQKNPLKLSGFFYFCTFTYFISNPGNS